MGFLSRFFGAPKPPATVPVVSASAFKGRMRIVQVVGESHYEGAIARVAGPKTPDGVDVRTSGELVPDPTNRQDPNAVMVKLHGWHVGHLSREQAVGFHRAMTARGLAGHALNDFEGRVHAGWKRPGGDEGSYSVTLYLPESLAKEIGFD